MQLVGADAAVAHSALPVLLVGCCILIQRRCHPAAPAVRRNVLLLRLLLVSLLSEHSSEALIMQYNIKLDAVACDV